MRFLIRLFTPNQQLTKKISELEKKISVLEADISKVKAVAAEQKETSEEKKKESSPAVLIEHLRVDNIIIEHLDYANNFGQLGIRDLSGRLNIGTSFEGDISKKVNEIVKEKLGNEARVNFRAKKDS